MPYDYITKNGEQPVWALIVFHPICRSSVCFVVMYSYRDSYDNNNVYSLDAIFIGHVRHYSDVAIRLYLCVTAHYASVGVSLFHAVLDIVGWRVFHVVPELVGVGSLEIS